MLRSSKTTKENKAYKENIISYAKITEVFSEMVDLKNDAI